MTLNPDAYDGVLLGVSNLSGTVMLRIDSDPVCRAPEAAENVWEVRLKCAEPSTEDLAELSSAVGQHISWRVESNDGEDEVALYLNYGADPSFTFKVQETARTRGGYTREDLHQKCQTLAALFTDHYHAAYDWEKRYGQLIARMNQEVDKRIDRENRKAAFFESSDPVRSQRYARSRDAYQEVRNLLGMTIDRREPAG